MRIDKDGVYISNPYIHHHTGKASISVVIADLDKYKVFDIDLVLLLEHLKRIEHNSAYERYKKVIYSIGSLFLSILIALSIATLMVVFKIALDDYTQMLAAFYLMIGTTLMFVGLGHHYRVLMGIEKKE